MVDIYVASVPLIVILGIIIFATMKLSSQGGKRGFFVATIVLGSGGHTAEMLALLQAFDLELLKPRSYIVADTDRMSAEKATKFEEGHHEYSIHRVPRSREVGQSFVTSVWTTAMACWYAIVLMFELRPDLVLVNGPGTCIPVCMAALLVRTVGVAQGRIVYVESIARVKRLSLSGKILHHLHLADLFFVQWEELANLYPGTLYVGRLM